MKISHCKAESIAPSTRPRLWLQAVGNVPGNKMLLPTV